MKVILLISLVILLCIGGSVFLVKDTGGEYSGHWQKIVSEDNLSHSTSLVPMKFFDRNNGIALKTFSIQQTSDGGRKWRDVYHKEENGVYGGTFTNEDKGWVVGTKNLTEPLVLITTDKGSSWKEMNFDVKSLEMLKGKFSLFRDICFDPKGSAWISGDGGLVEIDSTQQQLKLVRLISVKEGLFNISCNDSGEIWAIGVKNSLFNFKGVWNKIDINEKFSFSNVKSIGKDVWLIGYDSAGQGVLLKSQDGGKTWENKAPESASVLNDLYLKDKKGWLIGNSGKIYYSDTDGNSWKSFSSPTNSDLLSIYFLDSNNGWISGDNATILKYQN
jgi:photosystem II stability/assembly factor-like uncharacterized protein